MKKLFSLLLSITSLTLATKAVGSQTSQYTPLTGISCGYNVEVDAEPGIPKGTPMEMLRCSLKVVKTPTNYEVYVISEKGMYPAGEPEKTVYRPAEAVRVATAKNCAYPTNSPMTFVCGNPTGGDLLQSVLETSDFSVNYYGTYTPIRLQSVKVSISPRDGFSTSKDREKIKDCIEYNDGSYLLGFSINTSEDPKKSCKIK